MTPGRRELPGVLKDIRAWFDHPVFNGWVLTAIAVLLALRKPWALSTPQLWAEDGSVFLTHNDLYGTRAILEPYSGYLHLIPRLVAWLASNLADPAWWPAIYNGTAFVIAVAVIARTFSRRLDLPGKPWLALAFFLGPNSGEVLFNITNVQWFTGVLLIQQALLAPPSNARERVSDLLIVLVAGLTGPFVIAFWPLLAWRWARERSRDSLAVLLVATGCALTQGLLVLLTGPQPENPPFNPERFAQILGQQFTVWPLLGDHAATSLSPIVVALVGIPPAVLLLVLALRPSPRRPLRGVLLSAFLLISVAMAFRTRIDDWDPRDLASGGRYIFIPRLLLYWLLILEFDSASKLGRWISRTAALVVVLVHLKGYSLPPMPDYHWAEHCEPIRQGVPAKIPTLPTGWTLEYPGRPPHDP